MNPDNNSKTKTYPELELALLRQLPYPTLSLCEAECLANLQFRIYRNRDSYPKQKRRGIGKSFKIWKVEMQMQPKSPALSLAELFEKRMEGKKMKMLRNSSIALVLLITAGCSAQQIPPAPVVTAPPVTNTAFVQLNSGAPVTALTFTDLPATGSFCYFVQMLDGAGVSGASNIACNTTTTSLKHIVLSWSPAAGYVCQNAPCTYVMSRAPAVLTPVGAPSLQPAGQAAKLETVPDIQLQLAMR